MIRRGRHLVLATMTTLEWQAVRDGEAGDRTWAPGYPTVDDIRVATLMYDGQLDDSDHSPWGAWQMRLTDGTVIGGAGFKGPPDESGTVEIWYGLVPQMRGRGLAREAVGLLLDAAAHFGAVAVAADTDIANIASQRVLAASGFDLVAEGRVGPRAVLWWRCALPTGQAPG